MLAIVVSVRAYKPYIPYSPIPYTPIPNTPIPPLYPIKMKQLFGKIYFRYSISNRTAANLSSFDLPRFLRLSDFSHHPVY